MREPDRPSEAGAALRRLDMVLLVVIWLASLLAWRDLPERFPIHFDAAGQPDGWATRDGGGFLIWMLLPAITLAMSLVMRWAARFAMTNPGMWSIPHKREFLALDPAAQAPIIARLVRFLMLVMVLTTALLGLAQLTIFVSAAGNAPAATAALWAVTGFTVLILILALRVSRTVSREIQAATAGRADDAA